MTSQPGLQRIAIHILPNISQSKSNQTMKFGQLIEYNKRKAIFLVETYFERNSYTAAQEAFRQRYNRAPPCKKTIQQNLKNTVHME